MGVRFGNFFADLKPKEQQDVNKQAGKLDALVRKYGGTDPQRADVRVSELKNTFVSDADLNIMAGVVAHLKQHAGHYEKETQAAGKLLETFRAAIATEQERLKPDPKNPNKPISLGDDDYKAALQRIEQLSKDIGWGSK